MSHKSSGCEGLNMYNTSRDDLFFFLLKPLKMAPYFLKPIGFLRLCAFVQKSPAP